MYLGTYLRILGRGSGYVSTDPPSLCVTASAYVGALIRYRNPTCYTSKKQLKIAKNCKKKLAILVLPLASMVHILLTYP